MQAFDKSNETKVMAMPHLTVQSKQYGRDQLPFLAFGGMDAPVQSVQEYQTAERFNVTNTYGDLGRGQYKANYGLIWDGEPPIYDTGKERDTNKRMYNMTMPAKSEKQMGETGPVIEKDGKIQCTPGYVLQNGNCIMQTSTPVCQPGWRKVDGVCVKAPREFQSGKPEGSFGTAEGSVKYPMTKDNILSLDRLRQYTQEKEDGTKTDEGTDWLMGIVSIIGLLIFLAVLFFWFMTR